MGEVGSYWRAPSIEAACARLEAPASRVIAGGTDLLLKGRGGSAEPVDLVDIGWIKDLDGVREEAGGVRIGAATRLGDIVRSPFLQDACFAALLQGAVQVGSPQIRNLATLGGNIANASPSADTAAPLLVLDAEVEIASSQGRRSLPIASFFVGPGKSALKPGELVTSFFIPAQPDGSRSVYLKHSPRRAMDLAIVGVAVLGAGPARPFVRIALSAVAPTPIRVTGAENLVGSSDPVDAGTLRSAARLAAQTARPIDDVRASAAYRTRMVDALTNRALVSVLGSTREGA